MSRIERARARQPQLPRYPLRVPHSTQLGAETVRLAERALAAGCPFVLKPASLTPVGAILIAEVLAETDLPEGALPEGALPEAEFTLEARVHPP